MNTVQTPNENQSLFLGKGDKKSYKLSKPAVRIHASCLFKFMKKLDYLETILRNKYVSPRYVIEPIKYLGIKNIEKIAIPMICFCDINLHNLDKHVSRYGGYGIAFSKEWGIKRGIQPIQYINQKSVLRKDYSRTINGGIKMIQKQSVNDGNDPLDYALLAMMFYKPYSTRNYCFLDECEWRSVPNVQKYGYKQLITDKDWMDQRDLDIVSDALGMTKENGLEFEYDDVKYIIINESSDLEPLFKTIEGIKMGENQKRELISKIVVWENSREDF